MWFLQILGMIGGGLMIRYREYVADSIGEADWMKYFGGVYNFVVILGIFVFFWSLAALTGTMHILFSPITFFFRGMFS